MRDLRQDLGGLWQTAQALPGHGGGRIVLFIGPRAGEGTSSVAVSFAQIAAQRSARMTWLVDLDVRKNPLYTAFAKGRVVDGGRPLHALDASLGTEQIYAAAGPDPGKLMTAHQIEGGRLLVTRFRHDRLAPGQGLQLRTAPGWWAALRKAADWVVVDAPAADRSRAGLAFVSQADGVVIVARADETPAAEIAALRDEVGAHGGTVLGLVLNQVKDDARFASRFEERR